MHEKYTVGLIRGPRRASAPQAITNLTAGGTTFDKPVDYIGTEDDRQLRRLREPAHLRHRHSRAAAPAACSSGQRKDPFVVNLGETFDLVNIKYPAIELNPLAEFATVDSLADANVTSLMLEVPIACLTEGKGDDHRRLDDGERAGARAR